MNTTDDRPTPRAGRLATETVSAATGFSLFETVIALGLAVSLIGTLLPLYWNAVRGVLLAHDYSVGAMLAAQRLEQLRALEFQFDVDGTGAWSRATDHDTDLSGEQPQPGGTGLAPSPASALLASTPGFVDYLDVRGRWLGNDPDPPAGAAFVRRWAVTPLASAPDDAIVLQVMVAPVTTESRGGPRVDATRRPGDVWLTLVRHRIS